MAKRAEKWQVITPISDQELETREKERRALQRVKQSMMDLKTSLREMIFAFDILVPVAIEEDFPLMTNGKELYVSASYVADKASSELKKEILHITLHGLLGHFEEEKHLSDSELAWAAMDLKVEKMLRFYRDADQVTPREYLQLKGAFGEKANRIKREPIGMELYYRGKEDPVFRKKVLKNGERARRDDHHAWRMKSIQVGLLMGIDGQQGSAANKEGYGEEWSAAAKAVGELLRQCGNEVGGNGENGYLESVLEKMLEKAARIFARCFSRSESMRSRAAEYPHFCIIATVSGISRKKSPTIHAILFRHSRSIIILICRNGWRESGFNPHPDHRKAP